MSPTTPLEIKVIYSASDRPRRRRRITELTSLISPDARSMAADRTHAVVRIATKSRRGWIVVALLNVLIAGGLYYGTWWKADKFIYDVFVWSTPLPGMDLLLQQMFPGYAAAAASEDGRPESEGTDETPAEDAGESATAVPRFEGKTARTVIVVTAYGWLTMSTISLCALALAGGTAIVRVGGAVLQRIGLLLAVVGALFLIWQAYAVYTEYNLAYPPTTLRYGMGALVIWFLPAGMAFNRAHLGIMRLAATTLILAGACTMAAIYLGRQCGVIEQEWSGLIVLPLAFVAHSFYGWLLLPVSSRLSR